MFVYHHHLPIFLNNKNNNNDKISHKLALRSEHAIVVSKENDGAPAIASQGFPSNQNGTHALAVRIENMIGAADIMIGLTSTEKISAKGKKSPSAFPGGVGDICGCCLWLHTGDLHGGNGDNEQGWKRPYLSPKITQKAKEVVLLLTISNNKNNKKEVKRSVQFIVDGFEGPEWELAPDVFDDEKYGGNEIFATVSLAYKGQLVEYIPVNQVRFRSPKLDRVTLRTLAEEPNFINVHNQDDIVNEKQPAKVNEGKNKNQTKNVKNNAQKKVAKKETSSSSSSSAKRPKPAAKKAGKKQERKAKKGSKK